MSHDYWTRAHGETMPHNDTPSHADQARNILNREDGASQPDPAWIAVAQVHATLALVEEQAKANKIAEEANQYYRKVNWIAF